MGVSPSSVWYVLWVVMVTELSEKLDSELREMKVTHQLLKEQNDDLRHKMSFFIRVSRISVSVSSIVFL